MMSEILYATVLTTKTTSLARDSIDSPGFDLVHGITYNNYIRHPPPPAPPRPNEHANKIHGVRGKAPGASEFFRQLTLVKQNLSGSKVLSTINLQLMYSLELRA
jgi:hypothetical protein